METSEFLQKVYGGLDNGYLSVTTFAKDGEARTKWFDTGQLDEMAAYAVEAGKSYNTYFGINPRTKNLGSYLCGKREDISSVVGAYTDFDIKGGAHKEENLRIRCQMRRSPRLKRFRRILKNCLFPK